MAGSQRYGNRYGMESRSYRRRNTDSSYPSNDNYKKRSGAKFGFTTGKVDKNGKPGIERIYVSAWRVNREGHLLKFSAFENKNSKKWVNEKSGIHWVSLIGEVVNTVTGITDVIPFLLDADNCRAFIKKRNEIITAAGDSGYWGSHFNKEFKPGGRGKGGFGKRKSLVRSV